MEAIVFTCQECLQAVSLDDLLDPECQHPETCLDHRIARAIARRRVEITKTKATIETFEEMLRELKP